jgi:organic hydroperoxide reductase OsmC/OhrA
MSNERISDALHGAMAYLSEHPDEARYTDSAAIATLEQGLRVEVEVTSESDDRGIMGLADDVPAAPLNVAVRATVAGVGVEETRLREAIEWAHAHCPVQDAAARAVPVSLRIDVESA